MGLKKTGMAILMAVVTVVSSGCFEFEQEIYINADGSGRSTLRYILPQSFIQNNGKHIVTDKPIPLTREEVTEFFGNREGLYVEEATVYDTAGYRLFKVSLTFDNISALSERDLRYSHSIEGDEHVVRIHFDRNAHVNPQKKQNPLGDQLMHAMPTQGMKFRIFAPRKLTSSNSTNWDANTAFFNAPMSYLLNSSRPSKTFEARFNATKMERFKNWVGNLF